MVAGPSAAPTASYKTIFAPKASERRCARGLKGPDAHREFAPSGPPRHVSVARGVFSDDRAPGTAAAAPVGGIAQYRVDDEALGLVVLGDLEAEAVASEQDISAGKEASLFGEGEGHRVIEGLRD